jgi:sec-independent protein translocase protein TatC
MIAGVLLVFLGLFYFANEIYTLVSQPLQDLLPENSSMIATDVASPFFAPFKLTMVVSVLIAMPVVLYQIWAFIAPGLYSKEKRVALPLLILSVLLFYGGIAFAYFVVFPILFGFFTAVGPEQVQVMTDINSYLDFVLKLFFAFGLAFQIPIAVILLCWTGVTSPEDLGAKRPYVVVGCFVFGMLLTPPDIFSQSLLAGPMWLLFEVGVLFGKLVAKRENPSES